MMTIEQRQALAKRYPDSEPMLRAVAATCALAVVSRDPDLIEFLLDSLARIALDAEVLWQRLLQEQRQGLH